MPVSLFLHQEVLLTRFIFYILIQGETVLEKPSLKDLWVMNLDAVIIDFLTTEQTVWVFSQITWRVSRLSRCSLLSLNALQCFCFRLLLWFFFVVERI